MILNLGKESREVRRIVRKVRIHLQNVVIIFLQNLAEAIAVSFSQSFFSIAMPDENLAGKLPAQIVCDLAGPVRRIIIDKKNVKARSVPTDLFDQRRQIFRSLNVGMTATARIEHSFSQRLASLSLVHSINVDRATDYGFGFSAAKFIEEIDPLLFCPASFFRNGRAVEEARTDSDIAGIWKLLIGESIQVLHIKAKRSVAGEQSGADSRFTAAA